VIIKGLRKLYLMKWTDWRMRTKLRMLAVNMIMLALNLRHKMGTAKTLKLKLKIGMVNRITLVKLNKC
jgi:hypothetical protein